MDAPQEEFYIESRPETLVILFRIITHESWRELQGWHEALPGSRMEHVLHGIYVLIIEAGGVRRLAR